MTFMRAIVIGGFFLAVPGLIFLSPRGAQGDSRNPDQIALGRYLVHDVAKCIECHSPRNRRGELDSTRLFQGAPIPVKSPFPNRQWAFQAPAIAGLPGWSGEEVEHLLVAGRRLSGRIPDGPMPQFQLSKPDAAAVVAYLKSLR